MSAVAPWVFVILSAIIAAAQTVNANHCLKGWTRALERCDEALDLLKEARLLEDDDS